MKGIREKASADISPRSSNLKFSETSRFPRKVAYFWCNTVHALSLHASCEQNISLSEPNIFPRIVLVALVLIYLKSNVPSIFWFIIFSVVVAS